MSTKERILEAVRQMPESTTYDQAIERILFLQELEASIAEADAGMLIPLEEIEAEMDTWRA
jgi:predicted transcriptional regulator